MKIIIKGLFLALVLIASAPALYADIIAYSEIQTPRPPFTEKSADGQDLQMADQGQMPEVFESDLPIESMISLNTDGSLAFLLDVSRSSVYFIHNEMRSAPSQSAPVPEPGTIMLVGFGIMSSSLLFSRQKKG